MKPFTFECLVEIHTGLLMRWSPYHPIAFWGLCWGKRGADGSIQSPGEQLSIQSQPVLITSLPT